MLKKLLKYSLKDIFKVLIVFYIVGLVFGILTRVFFLFDGSLAMNVFGQICTGVTISMFFNILINNLMRVWVRFKFNLYGDESYLTHTLPIEKSTHYLSKFLTAVITFSVSMLTIITIFITAYYTPEFWASIKTALSPIFTMFGNEIIVFLVLILFLEFVNILQCGYTGIILGHRRNYHKNGFSVLFGFIAFSISQLFVLLTIFVAALLKEDLMKLFTSADMLSPATAKLVLLLTLLVYFAAIVIGYFVNLKFLKKGVNVD